MNRSTPTPAHERSPVLMHIEGHIAVVTINRPSARNAIDSAVALELSALVQKIESDPAIRAAILTGVGFRAFCAGADLKEMATNPKAERSTPDGGFAGFVYADRKKPWIAAVNGTAMAGGLELMLACDMAIASSQAVFALPEVKRGLVAGANGVYKLPRVLPRGMALEMILTGEPINAQRALQAGLVNYVVEPEAVLDTALRVASAICDNAPLAVAESLAIAREATDFDEHTLRNMTQAAWARVRQTEDAREGARAFVEGRKAVWEGR